MLEKNLHKKTIANAISAYLMLFISITFLFNKINPHLNNPFVKAHTKQAFTIHLYFLATYIVFISYGVFKGTSFSGIPLNHIIATSLFILGLIRLFYGMYQASKGEINKNASLISISGKKKLLDVNGDLSIDEKDKITLILSYIPFISFVQFAKYRKHEVIQNNTKLSLIASLIISLLYIFEYVNIANIILLIFIIFIVFNAINLFSRDKLIHIHLEHIPGFDMLHSLSITIGKYFKNYISNTKFIEFTTLLSQTTDNKEKEIVQLSTEAKKMPDMPLPKVFIYLPIINLITVLSYKSKYIHHIRNGLILTLLLIIGIMLVYTRDLESETLLLLLFPICFGIGHSKVDLGYRMPFIYDLYRGISSFCSLFKRKAKQVQQLHNKEVNTTFETKK